MKQYLVSTRKASYAINHAELVAVFRRGEVAQLPWATPGLAGLIDSESGVLPLLQADSSGAAADSPESATSLCAIVRLPTGAVAVDIDHIQEEPAHPGTDVPRLVAKLTVQASGFSPVAARQQGEAPEALATTSLRETFLHVRSGTTERAIPASRAYRVGKPHALSPLSPPDTIYWVAELDDELMACRSLDASPANSSDAPTGRWCICLDDPSTATGVLVDEVLGLIEVAPSQVRRVHHDEESSTWLAIPGRSPLRVLDKPGADQKMRMRNDQTVVPQTSVSGPDISSGYALSLSVGAYRLVVPQALLGMVLGPLSQEAITTHPRRGRLPVIDLRRAFGCRQQTGQIFAITLSTAGKHVVLLADHAEAAAHEPAVSPVPTLPAALFPHLKAIRLVDKKCELFLQDEFPRAAWKELKRRIPKEAFVGWIDQPV